MEVITVIHYSSPIVRICLKNHKLLGDMAGSRSIHDDVIEIIRTLSTVIYRNRKMIRMFSVFTFLRTSYC